MMKNNKHKSNNESGNALIFVLIGVALFAALSFTVARSLQSENTNKLSEREAKLIASEVLDYARKMERAVDRVRRNGCSEEDIDFHDHQTNEDCKIFGAAGGNMKLVSSADRNWHSEPPHAWPSDKLFFHGGMRVEDIGTNVNGSGSDLIMWIPNTNRTLCLAINDQLGIENPSGEAPRDSTSNALDGVGFNGTYGGAINVIDAPGLPGQKTGCFVSDRNGTSQDRYFFYHVLLAR